MINFCPGEDRAKAYGGCSPSDLELKTDERARIIELAKDGEALAWGSYKEIEDRIAYFNPFEISPTLLLDRKGVDGINLLKEHFKERGFKSIRLIADANSGDGFEETPYSFWILNCGFKELGNGNIQYDL
jgi:hypothetical protein